MPTPSQFAVTLLAASAIAQSSAPDAPPQALELTGTVAYEAHLARPHATRDLGASLRVFRDGTRARLKLRETAPGQKNPEPTVYLRDPDGHTWVRAPGRQQFTRGTPETDRLVQVLLDAANDAARGTHQIAYQHPRLGDLADAAQWANGANGPELRVRWHRSADQVEFVLRPATAAPSFDAATAFELGEADRSPPPAPRAPAPARFRTLASGVHEITLPTADTRALAVEFADHVVLCETAGDDRDLPRRTHVPRRQQRLLFQGDLGWFAGPNGPRGGGVRARGLLKAIDDRKLPVETLVQSWPTIGLATLPMAEFRALLAK